MSVQDLADAAKCSKWTVYKIETGASQPSAKSFLRLRQALGVDSSALEDTSWQPSSPRSAA